jgi:restriction endonuclease S subunit
VRANSFVLVGSRYRKIAAKISKYPVLPIEDICIEVIGGGTPSSNNQKYWDGNIPWITSADISDYNEITIRKYITQEGLEKSTSNIIPKGNIIVVSRVGLGKIAIAPFDLAINQDLQGLIINRGMVLPEYVLLVFSTVVEEMLLRSRGTTIKGITKQELLDLTIPIPPLQDQKLIVDELLGYQRIVDGARTIVDNYKPTLRVDSEWDCVNIGSLFTVVSDTIDPQSKTGIVNYIGLENIVPDTGELTGVVEVDIRAIKSTKRIFKVGDILYGKLRPNLRKVWFANIDGICSTDIIVLRPKVKDILAEFYCILMHDATFNAMVLNGVSGGQLPRVDIGYFLSLPIPCVSFETQQILLSQTKTEQSLVESSKRLIEIFQRKLQAKIGKIRGD